MPEGPEVRITTDFLKSFENKGFTGYSILSGRYAKKGAIPGKELCILTSKLIEVNCIKHIQGENIS